MPRAPTWLVPWHPADAYGLGPHGATARVVARRYVMRVVIAGQSVRHLRG